MIEFSTWKDKLSNHINIFSITKLNYYPGNIFHLKKKLNCIVEFSSEIVQFFFIKILKFQAKKDNSLHSSWIFELKI